MHKKVVTSSEGAFGNITKKFSHHLFVQWAYCKWLHRLATLREKNPNIVPHEHQMSSKIQGIFSKKKRAKEKLFWCCLISKGKGHGS